MIRLHGAGVRRYRTRKRPRASRGLEASFTGEDNDLGNGVIIHGGRFWQHLFSLFLLRDIILLIFNDLLFWAFVSSYFPLLFLFVFIFLVYSSLLDTHGHFRDGEGRCLPFLYWMLCVLHFLSFFLLPRISYSG